jgi:hypothetical protein
VVNASFIITQDQIEPLLQVNTAAATDAMRAHLPSVVKKSELALPFGRFTSEARSITVQA